MAAMPSTMLDLGTMAPPFRLPDTEGKIVSIDDFAGAPALLVMFICNHCPFVKHVRQELGRLGRQYQARGAAIVAISSNDVAQFPADGPDGMRAEIAEGRYTFPYLYDESQAVAKSYRAACTPDFFVFDGARKLVYRGQLDDSRPSNGQAANGRDLRAALDAVLAGAAVQAEQKPSIGCGIKWKEGGEPDWWPRS